MPIQSATNCTNTELQTSEFKHKFQHRPVCQTNLGALSAKAPTLQGRLETWLLAQRNIPRFPARLPICRARLQKTATCQPAKFQYPGKGSCHLLQDFHHQTGTSSTLPKQAAKLGSSSKLQPAWQELNTKATARLERLACNTAGFPAALTRLPNCTQARHFQQEFQHCRPWLQYRLAGLQNCSSVRQSSNTARKMLRAKGKKPMKLQKPRRNKKNGSWERMPRSESGKVKNLEKIKTSKNQQKSRP